MPVVQVKRKSVCSLIYNCNCNFDSSTVTIAACLGVSSEINYYKDQVKLTKCKLSQAQLDS